MGVRAAWLCGSKPAASTAQILPLNAAGSSPKGKREAVPSIGEDEGSRRAGPDACVVAERDTRRTKLAALRLRSVPVARSDSVDAGCILRKDRSRAERRVWPGALAIELRPG